MTSEKQPARLAIDGHQVVLIVVALVLVALALFFAIFFVWADAETRQALLQKAGEGLVLFILVGVLGVVAKELIGQFTVRRQEEAELREAQLSVLNATTASYWQIKKAFHVIAAHRTVEIYGEQMRAIIDYRLELQRIDNEISSGMYAFGNDHAIGDALAEIDRVLARVMEEWRDRYAGLVTMRRRGAAGRQQVADILDTLPALSAVRGHDQQFGPIHTPFEDAVKPMRAKLGFNQFPERLEALHTW